MLMTLELVTMKNNRKVLLSDDITNSLILNMMTMLKEIEKRYPKNIKVNEE